MRREWLLPPLGEVLVERSSGKDYYFFAYLIFFDMITL